MLDVTNVDIFISFSAHSNEERTNLLSFIEINEDGKANRLIITVMIHRLVKSTM